MKRDENQSERETESKGELVPPPNVPPTAVGAGTSGPEEHGRVITVSERTTTGELAELMQVPPRTVIDIGFRQFGKLLVVRERVGFELARDLAAVLGFVARRPSGGSPTDASDS